MGGRIGTMSTSVAISYSHRTYSGFAFPMQHLQEFALSVTNILYNISAKAKLRCPLLWMWSLVLTEALRQPVIYSMSPSALHFGSGLSRRWWSMMTTCPASLQSLPVPGVIACVLKHRASLSPQTLTCFPLCSPNACGRHVFGIGDREPHAERWSCCCCQGLCPAVPPHLTQVEPGQIDPQRGQVPGQEGGSPPNPTSWLSEGERGWGTPPLSMLLPPHWVSQVPLPSAPPFAHSSIAFV